MRTPCIFVACALAVTGPAAARDSAQRLELTPYAGFRFGGELEERDGERDFALDEGAARGMIFNFRAGARGSQWEALYAHQATKLETAAGARLALDVDYLQFGGTYLFEGSSMRPFVAATVGAAHFSPNPAGFDTETNLSGSLGGGAQLRADKRIGVRLEARLYATFLDQDGDIFCSTGGATNACALTVEGNWLIQWEARVGVVFRFSGRTRNSRTVEGK